MMQNQHLSHDMDMGSCTPASGYPPSHPPSDFRYTFPRPPTRNFARTPHEVLLLEYRRLGRKSMGSKSQKACRVDNCKLSLRQLCYV